MRRRFDPVTATQEIGESESNVIIESLHAAGNAQSLAPCFDGFVNPGAFIPYFRS